MFTPVGVGCLWEVIVDAVEFQSVDAETGHQVFVRPLFQELRGLNDASLTAMYAIGQEMVDDGDMNPTPR